jgi:thiosulfate reductase electron transport protein
MGACPYKVRFLDKAKGTADKCDFCGKTRLANGEQPACVSVCPTDALTFARIDSPEAEDWLKNTDIYQDELPGTGKLQLYRRKETHRKETYSEAVK